MRKVLIIFSGLVAVAFLIGITAHFAVAQKNNCITIKDGVLTYSAGQYLAGQPLIVGFDEYGYNYQAHLFNGYYINSLLGRYGFPPYEGDDTAYYSRLDGEGLLAVFIAHSTVQYYWQWRDVTLNMKWNDAWLSNRDCDGDGALDRYYGHGSYIGSGAWETNHMSGSYIDVDGKECHWTYFVKIVAVPDDATKVAGIWYAADGTEIGPDIWGAFAEVQWIENDPCAGIHGAQYISPVRPGYGYFK